MKKLFCLMVAAFAAITVSAQQLPNVEIENAEGRVVSVRDYVGKPLIISFWQITCKPCIQELNAINDQLDDWKAEADFEVIAVSVDDVRMKAGAKSMSAARGWEFVCLFDENQALKRAMNVSQTPQAFVVDKEGNIVYSHTGHLPGGELELFEKVLELQ